NPGTTPGTTPGTNPGTTPGTTPGTNPGTTPGTNPGTNPATNPSVNPATNSGTNPGTNPSATVSNTTVDNNSSNNINSDNQPILINELFDQNSSSTLDQPNSVDSSEKLFTQKFQQYLGISTDAPVKTIAQTRNLIQEIEEATGIKPAIMYVSFIPQKLVTGRSIDRLSSDNSSGITVPTAQDQLELVLITSKGAVIRKRIEGATREKVIAVANNFRSQVTNLRSQEGDYLAPAKQLYDWMVAPLEADFKAQGIQNLSFIVDTGLRSIPFAALHDGKQFLIEKYSIGLMPSLSLTDTRYKPIKNLEVLAMGAASFTDQKPLPAVPVELLAITPSLWQGKSFLNDGFTLENLKNQRKDEPFGIIHLATHANFQPGEVSNSYIQLWNSKLKMNQLSSLGWNNPPVELLVLSACRTALGNEEAELGFAGLAVQAGVKSALGSLWYVSDRGTLGLMTEFYQQLKQTSTKSEALRQTQLAMLQGKVYVSGGNLVADSDLVPLPPELVRLGDQTFKHPYFWSAFTMIGNPW
ncbi:CHAT domain-containing protein, partial [Limnofasciculus baicalensis]